MDKDLYSDSVKLETLSVDDLVQRLEQMEKSNEQIKRENQLFESHLIRKSKESVPSDEEIKKRAEELEKRGDAL
jgi:uncharacterized protein YdaT